MYPTKAETGIYWDIGVRLVSGCTPISSGCTHCWSRQLQKRFKVDGDPDVVKFHAERLKRFECKKPTIFAIWNDLFHAKVDIAEIDQTLDIMERNPQNIYLVLTKRAWRMQNYFGKFPDWELKLRPNVWRGVTAENQKAADERIQQLCATPAAVRFVSLEPLLEEIWLKLGWSYPGTWDKIRGCAINWVIIGAETGAGRRPCKEEWVRSLVQQCQAAGVPVWIKAFNKDGKVTHDINQFPKDLQLRQFPEMEVK